MTRGHRHDLDALRALAPRDLRYLGLIGSRAKVARIYEALIAESMPRRVRSSSVHAPIGLDIGAVTPQEIAVSHPGRADRRRTAGKIDEPHVAAHSLAVESAPTLRDD